ncbi:MAG: hypothetical protein LBD71_05475 [Treponema sp.]|jgi:hypothetical protein|nr:hypothetical protein [Treponema sp.]
MDRGIVIEAVGIFASIVISASIAIHNIKWLRIVNLAGSVLFAVYGVFIGSLPVVILNLFTIGVNIYYLILLRLNGRAAYDVLFMDIAKDEYIRYFLLFYGDDINRFFPSFDPNPDTGTVAGAECCFILRQTLPVALVVFRREGEEINILLDYAIPAYRDLKNGRFFFESVCYRIAPPGTVFTAKGENPVHCAYLRKVGFEETGSEGGARLFRQVI